MSRRSMIHSRPAVLPLLALAGLICARCAGSPALPTPAPGEPAESATTTQPSDDRAPDAGADDAGVADAGTETPEPRRLSVTSPEWFDLAAALAEREILARGFAARGYQPPERTHVLTARVERGVGGQMAFAYLSFADTGFVNSDGNFWPASAVKLHAALGALQTLAGYGLTGDAELDFEDEHGRFHRKAERLYCAALTRSSNREYDRLVRVAGLDEINQQFFTAEHGFRYAALQRAYHSKGEEYDLARSPEIAFSEGDREGTIPARVATGEVERCPAGDNCSSLFELTDALARVVLHHELPAAARFTVSDRDVWRLKRYLRQSKCGFAEPVAEVFGEQARIYNKRGYSPSFDMIDHAFVDDRKGGRYLLAGSVPFKDRDKDLAKAELAELGRHALALVKARRPEGPRLQHDSGAPIRVEVEPLAEGRMRVAVRVEGATATDHTTLHRGREEVAAADGAALEVDLPAPAESEIFVVQAFAGDEPVGFRAVAILRQIARAAR